MKAKLAAGLVLAELKARTESGTLTRDRVKQAVVQTEWGTDIECLLMGGLAEFLPYPGEGRQRVHIGSAIEGSVKVIHAMDTSRDTVFALRRFTSALCNLLLTAVAGVAANRIAAYVGLAIELSIEGRTAGDMMTLMYQYLPAEALAFPHANEVLQALAVRRGQLG